MRKVVAISVVVVSLVAIVGGVAVWRLWPQQLAASHKKATVVTHSTDTPSEEKPGSDYKWQGSVHDPKRLTVPSINVDAYLQNVGVDQKKEIAVPDNIHLGGWFVDSVRPGSKGLSIIDGHLNGPTADGVFIKLDKVKVGDTYTVTFGDDSKRTFRVVKVATVDLEDAASVLFSQEPSIERQLTLITCGGQWDSKARLYDKRVIVISEALDT